jgi:N-acetylneuraminate synthase
VTGHPVLIIAEAGVNHNGSMDMARSLIDEAARAGADMVKFQTFTADSLVTTNVGSVAYQSENIGKIGTQHDMLKVLELTADMHCELLHHCRDRGIAFLSTPFDAASIDLIVGLGVDRLKIASGELTNGPLLLHAARTGLPIILSTGMSTLDEIGKALSVLAFGYVASNGSAASNSAFQSAFASSEGQSFLKERVTLLHCTTDYPAPYGDVNLRAMRTIADRFGLPVGYSDHTEGTMIPVAAVAWGACVIEKHFTLDRSLPGPDHKASLEPGELAAMVRAIRSTEQALGSAEKKPTATERSQIAAIRKSLVAARRIEAGERFTEQNMTAKRAGSGRSPMEFWSLLGQPVPHAYEKDEPL